MRFPNLKRVKNSPYIYYIFKKDGQTHSRSTGETDERKAYDVYRRVKAQFESEQREEQLSKGSIADAAGADVDRAVAKGVPQRTIASTLAIHWVHLAKFFGGNTQLTSLTGADLKSYIQARRECGVRGQTIAREITTLKRGFRELEIMSTLRWPQVTPDPMDKAVAGREITQEVIAKWVSEMGEQPRAAALVTQATGLRAHELRKLEKSWITRNYLNLPDGATKGKNARSVYLTESILKLLQEAFERWGVRPFALNFKKSYEAASRRIGQPSITLRDLRHTFCTKGMQHGGDIKATMAAAGHKTMAAADRYQSCDLERVKKVGEAVEASKKWVSEVVYQKRTRGPSKRKPL